MTTFTMSTNLPARNAGETTALRGPTFSNVAVPPVIAACRDLNTNTMTVNGIVQKLWNYCNILRDDGLSYGDYVEQLTFLLFLKMAAEQMRPPYSKPRLVPQGLDWASLKDLDCEALDRQYRHLLTALGKKTGLLGVIFRKAQNKIQDPAKLKRLISDLIGREQWMIIEADVKGDAYEGLLQKNAEDVKGGAGQYFTPRALIAAIVDAVRPQPGEA